MYSTTRAKMLGLLYLAPLVIFVAMFTAYPLIQMVWMSFHNWSIIEPAKWVGVANFVKAWNDRQFWVSLGFTLKYTVYITPILMILGYLIALLVATNTPLRKFTRAVVFVPVVIGLSVSSLLWYWLFSYHYGLINKGLMDLGIVDKPVVWFGEDANRALWAVIISIVWKVVGFGMLLFVAAIQAIPRTSTMRRWQTGPATGSACGGSCCRSLRVQCCSSRSSASSGRCSHSTSSS